LYFVHRKQNRMSHRESIEEPRRVVVAVAPVAHVGTFLPPECRNPTTPGAIAEETRRCIDAGATVAHLHVRNDSGTIVSDLSCFSETLDRIYQNHDVIVNASTGGQSELSREQRCVALTDPRVEVASLNMGSSNLGDGVYINTIDDIRYWAQRIFEAQVVPELEIFTSGMIWSALVLAGDGLLAAPLHFNVCLGFPGATPAVVAELVHFAAMLPENSYWGFLHEGMTDMRLTATAMGLGACTLRVGYEDGGYLAPGKAARSNAELVEQLVRLIRAAGCEPASLEEARTCFGTKKSSHPGSSEPKKNRREGNRG
jgi:3-keto-5-aminohexanoate cleavage enzyme